MADPKDTKLRKIPISQVIQSTSALRKPNKKEEKYVQLVESIKRNGIFNPISVREVKDPTTGETKYAVVDGLHRFYGAQDAGLEVIPAQVLQMSLEEVRIAQIVANVQKIETKPAQYGTQLVKVLADDPTLTVDDLMVMLSKSRTWVENRLKLDKLPEVAKTLVDDHKIPVVNAYALADLEAVAPEEVVNYLDRAQTESPANFIQPLQQRIKQIKDARRAGRVPSHNLTFEPYPHTRRNADMKDECLNPKVGHKIVAAANAKTPVEGFNAGVAWCMRMDPISIEEDKAKFEKKKAEDEEAKRLRKEEADRQKALKAAHATSEALAGA